MTILDDQINANFQAESQNKAKNDDVLCYRINQQREIKPSFTS